MTTTTTHKPTTTTTLDDETRRVLATAKGILANGWCQRRYQICDSYCIVGALAAASGMHPEDFDYGDEKPTITLFNEMVGGGIADWNDAPGRTQQEVIDLIDQALQQ